ALPRFPQSASRGDRFRGFLVHSFATACQFARRSVRIWPVSRPTAPFTSRLSAARSPSPLLDMTTTSTGLLCWWDLHPLEWQLATLHQILARNAGAACRDLEDRAEPHLERLAGLLQERAGREARLMAAVGALERSALADRPHTRRVAVRTGRLTAPAGLNPIGAAVLF